MVVAGANKGLSNAFQLSAFYCHFDGTRFDNCPDGHNWNGNANWDINGATTNNENLVISFETPYTGDPFCAVSFENEWVHHRMDTYATGVTIVIADSGGNAKMWSTVNSWMMVTCYGTNALEINDISSEFGQLAAGVIVPSAHRDLEKQYMFSGFYCHFDGTRFDECPDGHVWGAIANFDMDAASASGNTLTVHFASSYMGDPFCRVSFEDVWVHHTQDSFPGGVNIAIADSGGQAMQWSGVSTWLMMVCHGTTADAANAGR